MTKISLRKPTSDDALAALLSVKDVDVWLPAVIAWAILNVISQPLQATIGVIVITYVNQVFRRMGSAEAAEEPKP